MNDEAKKRILARRKLIDAEETSLIKVTEEFKKSFAILEKYEKTVSIFGSARLPEETRACRDVYKLAAALARAGYAVVTGGGNGIMAAASKGAFDAGGVSIGFNIQLPHEQQLNPYTVNHYSFEHFFGRKVALTLQANAYIFCTGGFGTLDELFEIVTLEQTGKIPRVPIILFGSAFWRPMMIYVRHVLEAGYHTISPYDLKIMTVCDDIDEILEILRISNASTTNPKSS